METNQTQPPMPANHLALAIITTILCCLPAGIVSIIYASQVNTKYNAGDYEGALRASKNAKTWWIVALVVGLVIIIGYIAFIIIVGGEAFWEAYNEEMQNNTY
ncbi:CD225/dispanin family protein [Psychroflexus sp. YR1-1]|uniref:CD225/dispanin family protein n=1 Tax=Psychroflexus aurantiacus TaxID=2709310 RepID=A0A6B3R2A1_9FLAO|nr:CD225/dispanin family protein [Psychroflexus aurantiacus]NEV93197.1 CD225/dispanin family protein [Psychroflexus aurantiacus]